MVNYAFKKHRPYLMSCQPTLLHLWHLLHSSVHLGGPGGGFLGRGLHSYLGQPHWSFVRTGSWHCFSHLGLTAAGHVGLGLWHIGINDNALKAKETFNKINRLWESRQIEQRNIGHKKKKSTQKYLHAFHGNATALVLLYFGVHARTARDERERFRLVPFAFFRFHRDRTVLIRKISIGVHVCFKFFTCMRVGKSHKHVFMLARG